MTLIGSSPPLSMQVRWYFCDKEAEALPYATPFNSANWDSVKGVTALVGEDRSAPRPWRDGSPPPWGDPVTTCNSLTDTLPDTLYAEVTSASISGTDGDVFSVGQVIALPKRPGPDNVWGYTWGWEPIWPGGIGCTLAFGCITTAYYPWPAIYMVSFTQTRPDVFFDQMKGLHELGGRERWEGHLTTIPHPWFFVTNTGMCDACGISVWSDVGGLDPVYNLSNGHFSQGISLRFSGVNHLLPDPYHTFAPWFWPSGYMMPDFF